MSWIRTRLQPMPSGVFALWLFVAASPLGAEVRDLAASYADGTPTAPITATSYSVGSLTLDLSAARVHLLRDGERVVGAFVSGGGTVTYRNTEALASRNLEANVDRSTRATVENDVFTASFEEAWILDSTVSARLLPAGQPVDSSDAAPVDEGAVTEFGRFQRRFEDDFGPSVSQLAAQAQVEGRPEAVAGVWLSGRDDYHYLYDILRDGVESLGVADRLSQTGVLAGHRTVRTLIDHPAEHGALERAPRRWRLEHVDLDLRHPEGNRLELAVAETVRAEVGLETLSFGIWDEIYDGGQWVEYSVDEVTLADGTTLAWARQRRDLLVQLPTALAPGDTVELRFKLSGDILYRPGGHSFWWLPIGSWLPLPDRLDMKHFTYHAVVRSGEGFVPFSMGRTVRRWEEDGLACAEFELDRPVQFAVALAGEYNVHTEERDGLTIHLASYAFKRNDAMERIANNTFELIDLYGKILGDYPFSELSILEINSYGFGIAPPGVIYLTREAFDPGPEGRAYRTELNRRMAHEVAHHWWGHVAQMASFNEQWLSESTAEYYGAIAIGALLGERKFKEAIRTWKEHAAWADKADSVFYANQLTGEKAWRERYGLLYARGPLILHELREELGDQTFLTIFKSLLSSFPFETVDTDTFIRLTEHITGEDYRPWITERLLGLE